MKQDREERTPFAPEKPLFVSPLWPTAVSLRTSFFLCFATEAMQKATPLTLSNDAMTLFFNAAAAS